MEWQRGVDEAAKGFAGFRQTDIYPPSEGQGHAWLQTLPGGFGAWFTGQKVALPQAWKMVVTVVLGHLCGR